MSKIKYDHIPFLPKSYNFSEVTPVTEDSEVEFDASDLGIEEEKNVDNLDAENNLLRILNFLTDKEKVVFLYQIVRDDGFRLDHVTCANTLHISRSYYMSMLNKVKTKAKFILFKYKTDEKPLY